MKSANSLFNRKEKLVLLIATITIATLFTLPLIIYHVYRPPAEDWKNELKGLLNVLESSCSSTPKIENTTLGQSKEHCITKSTESAVCVPLPEDSFCKSYLEDIGCSVPLSISIRGDESEVQSIFEAIEDYFTFISPACREMGIPLLCQYYYRPCAPGGHTVEPSKSACLDVTNKFCEGEVSLLKNHPQTRDFEFPKCEELPEIAPICSEGPGVDETLCVPSSCCETKGGICSTFLSSSSVAPLLSGIELQYIDFIDGLILNISLEGNTSFTLMDNMSNCVSELPALCALLYPTCTIDGVISATWEDCVQLRETPCGNNLWSFLEERNISIHCQEWSNSSLLSHCNASSTHTSPNNSSVEVSTNITCHPGFYKKCSFCLPKCDSFNFKEQSIYLYEEVCKYIAVAVALIAGTIFIVKAVIHHKALLRFPTILVLYETVLQVLFVLSILIPPIGGINILCSSDSLIETLLQKGSPYCVISGVMFQFLLLLNFIFWLAHITYLSVMLVSPRAKSIMKRKKQTIIHISIVVVGIFISALGPIITLAGFDYIPSRLPPVYCSANNFDVLFYTFVFPLQIIMTIGVSLLIMLFWMTHKTQGLYRKGKLLSTPEAKLLLVSIAYFLAGVLSLVRFSESFATHDVYINLAIQYALCQLNGNNPSCPVLGVESGNIINGIVFLLLAGLPLSNLVFAFTSEDISRVTKFFSSAGVCKCMKITTFLKTQSTGDSIEFKKSNTLKSSEVAENSASYVFSKEPGTPNHCLNEMDDRSPKEEAELTTCICNAQAGADILEDSRGNEQALKESSGSNTERSILH